MLCGDWRFDVYEASMAKALTEVGAEVIPFKTSVFFGGLLGKIQQHIPFWNPATALLNLCLLLKVRADRPDILFLWRCTSISPHLLWMLKRIYKVTLVSYNNDDPFAFQKGIRVPWRYKYLWRWYLASTRICDQNFFYRSINLDDARAFGSKRPTLLVPYFRPWQDRVVTVSCIEADRFRSDVTFIGHFEEDGRDILIKKLVDSGIRVRLFGNKYWNDGRLTGYEDSLGHIVELWGDDYTVALNCAPIALCLFSKHNRDEYTRRSYEIPACGTVLLSERTTAMLDMFRENVEAVYFSSHDEAVAKVNWLIANPEIRNRISLAGQRRVHEIGGSIVQRAAFVLRELNQLPAIK
jgi:glycosyltransferase involved in cell wall biosynthesis